MYVCMYGFIRVVIVIQVFGSWLLIISTQEGRDISSEMFTPSSPLGWVRRVFQMR